MTTKTFIRKLITKIIIYAIISTIALTLLDSPIISNDLALGQMQNSDTLYLWMDMYYRVRPYISVIYWAITAFFAWSIGSDAYTFINNKYNKGEN